MPVQIHFKTSQWEQEFLHKIATDGPWSSWQLFQLAVTAEQNLLSPSFHGLHSLNYLPDFQPLPHQLEVAKQVIEQMHGKAILADEVGLGKTIEAGLILKEYLIRGLVKRALILVPASLVTQWVQEMNEKFLIPAVKQHKSYVWEQADIIVASLDTAKRPPHRDIIYDQDFDLIIIDEAHKLKNSKTQNYEFVLNLPKKFCLLLTATPIQNRIEEIFNLVSLLKPGHLGNKTHFFEKYKNDNQTLMEDENLKQILNKVMIRNRRIDTKIEWPDRHVETIEICQTAPEQQLYKALSSLAVVEGESQIHTFSLLTLQREACSSREAVYLTLQNIAKKIGNSNPLLEKEITNIFHLIEQIEVNSKAVKVVELINDIDDKVIIFTEYRATQLFLQWFLQQHNITSVPYRGGFKSGKKDWMRQLFQKNVQVLIATEAGGEGINLQFCNHVINYDLPWNPMRLEQRIGRVHRLGQVKDVYIYNFMTKNTIEEQVVKLLYEKINLFERVVGELDEILEKLQLDNLDHYIEDIFTTASSPGEVRIKMDNLTSFINFADHLEIKGRDDNATAGNS